MFESSRRQFLFGAMSAGGAALLAPSLQAVTRIASPDRDLIAAPTRLDANWQYRQGQLDGIWEVWREEEADLWQSVSLPHCFNHADACDPDRTYYQGHGWYRTTITIGNPFEGGRTILHFQGAGQTSSLWIGSTFIGTHKGGYDEFVFDITSDRKATYAVSIFLPEKSAQSWAASHGRELTEAEQYASAKLRLFRAFDELSDMKTDGRRLVIGPALLEEALASLGVE